MCVWNSRKHGTTYRTGRKKNALGIIIKAISLIKTEQQLIQWQLQNGGREVKSKERKKKRPIGWKGNSTDFVEMANGMIETGRFNDGEVEIEEFIDYLCEVFDFEVNDCFNTFRAIRMRVDENRTQFLDEMVAKLRKRMEDLDNGIFRKKKGRKNS